MVVISVAAPTRSRAAISPPPSGAPAAGESHCSLMCAALITCPTDQISSCMYLDAFSAEPPKKSLLTVS